MVMTVRTKEVEVGETTSVVAATLDIRGRISSVTPAWTSLTTAHGGDPARCGVGASYLEVCDAAAPSSPTSAAIGRAVRGILAGVDPDQTGFLLACPGVGGGWFELTVGPDAVPGGVLIVVEESRLFLDDVVFPGAVAVALAQARQDRATAVAGALQALGTSRLFGLTMEMQSLSASLEGPGSLRLAKVVRDLDLVIGELLALSLLVAAAP